MEVFDKVDFNEWKVIADKCEYATFFHTPTWAKILEATYSSYKIGTKLFVFEDGRRVILPLMKIRNCKGILNKYCSMPFTLYGSVVCDNSIDPKRIHKLFNYVADKNKFVSTMITGNPYCSYDLPSRYKKNNYFTQVLELNQQFETIWSSYKRSVRNKIRKAERNGIYAKVADNLGEYKEYFKIYRRSLERWGITRGYEFDLFKNIFEIAGSKAKLWLVCYQGKIVGGTLVFYHNWHCVEWHASFDENYFKFGIRNFLTNEIIKDALQNCLRIYDFNPSGGHEGVVRFKESFGAKKLFFKLWHYENSLYKVLERAYSFCRFIVPARTDEV